MSERTRRWRLVLGTGDAELGQGAMGELDMQRDDALSKLYEDQGRKAGLGRSSPAVARWLGDIRTYFPSTVVSVLQRDAITRLGLKQLLLEPEMLDAVEPDLDLVTTLVGLGSVIPESSRESARAVVRKVTNDLEEQLASRTRQAVQGALDRSARTRRPRHSDIDWNRTIAANLKHYQAEYGTVIPERLVGYGRRTTQVQREIVLAIDQSGSMAASVVYASVFGSVLASLRSVRTRLVAFDTEVVDLTEELDDPVDVLFGVQLGGGTDINRAVAYCETQIERPDDTVFVLISDLYEGGVESELLRRTSAMVEAGVTVVVLLALSDQGAPAYDAELAAKLTALGAPSFACTPDVFPDLMAAAIERRDLTAWLSSRCIPTATPSEPQD